jgi:hypothetical protein
MSFSRPIQWYHCHADPIWPDGTFESFITEKSKKLDLDPKSRGSEVGLDAALVLSHLRAALIHIQLEPSTIMTIVQPRKNGSYCLYGYLLNA